MPSARSRLEKLVSGQDHDFDLVAAFALVAADLDPYADADALVAAVKALPPREGASLSPSDPARLARSVSAYFHDTLGFSGDDADYYDPRNALLHHVLVRKKGIPLTLAVLWVALARSAGLAASVVGFPGHVLARVETPNGPLVLDPFHRGATVTEAEAEKLLRRVAGDSAKVEDAMMQPSTSRALLARLLSNLERSYSLRGDYPRALVAVDRLLLVAGESSQNLRRLLAQAKRAGAVGVYRDALGRLVASEPEASDREILERELAKLEALAPRPS